jgi:hypothetical protein
MADDTNTSDLARIMATDLPVSAAEREFAHRNRKLRQLGQPADDSAIVDPRLVSMLAGGGIGSDARFPTQPVVRDPPWSGKSNGEPWRGMIRRPSRMLISER